jgi:hypothetical protein
LGSLRYDLSRSFKCHLSSQKHLTRRQNCLSRPQNREYKDGDGILKTVNPALVPTGCDEHANRYAIYAVDSRQAINALAGEPRFLSIAPDMGLTDLTAADDLTNLDIKNLAAAFSADTDLSGIENPDPDRIAFLTVTSTWVKSTFVPNGIIQEDDDGIITDYPESTGIWSKAILNKNGAHVKYQEGCGSNPAGGETVNVDSAEDYNQCIDAAIRLQEAEYTIDANEDQVGAFADFEVCAAGPNDSPPSKGCYACKTLARYGTEKNTVRFNKVLSACALEDLMVTANVTDESGGPKFKLQGCSKPFPPLTNRKLPKNA